VLEYLTVQQPMGKLKSDLNNLNGHLLLINVDFLKKHTAVLCPAMCLKMFETNVHITKVNILA
jgi:hypothetical protein